MFRSSPPEVFSWMLYKYEANPQEDNPAEAQSQQSHFATLLKSHPCTDVPQRIHSTLAKQLSPGEHLWETLSVCQKKFIRLKL